jgi:outer membrane protein, heavy metal efflux system
MELSTPNRMACGATLLALAIPGLARGAENGALTLESALQVALGHSPELRASVARLEAAQGQARQAGAWPNPSIEASVEDWPTASSGFSASKRLLGVSQTLPFPGKKSLDNRIGASGVRASQAHLALRRLDLLREVKAAFYAVLAAAKLVEVSRELAQVADSSATTARRRVDAGAAPLQEQLRAEVERDHASAAFRNRERDLGIARETLATVLGRPDLAEAPVAGSLPEAVDATLLARATEASLDEHPAVAGSHAARDRADLEWRRSRLEPYPDLTVAVAAGRVGLGDEGIVQVGVAVALPLFDRGQGRQQEARANLAVRDAELVATRQRLRLSWSAAARRFRTAHDQVALHRERILPRAEEALRLVQIGFTEGKLGLIDLLDTQRTVAEARESYIETVLEMNVALAEVEALAGVEVAPTGARDKGVGQ